MVKKKQRKKALKVHKQQLSESLSNLKQALSDWADVEEMSAKKKTPAHRAQEITKETEPLLQKIKSELDQF